MMEGDRHYGCDPARSVGDYESLVEITERPGGVYEVTGVVTIRKAE